MDEYLTLAREQWELNKTLLNTSCHICFYGPPATGKTKTSLQIRGGFRVPMTEDTPAAELRGHFIPAEGGGFKWHDGPAVKSMRMGTATTIDEIDKAGGDALAMMLAIADTTPEITLPTNETITAEEGFCITATTNARPSALSPALRDRFLWVEVLWPNPDALNGIAPIYQRAARRDLYSPRSDNEPNRFTVRDWMRLSHLTNEIGQDNAIAAVVGPDNFREFKLGLQLGAASDA